MTATLIDGLLWVVTLGVLILVARQVVHRRDLPARLFVGMILTLGVYPLFSLAWFVSIPVASWFPQAVGADLAERVRQLWPIQIGAFVILACLTLHLFSVFPTSSRLLRRGRGGLMLLYAAGILLAILSVIQALTPLATGVWPAPTVWPQVLFATAVMGLAIGRLVIIYSTRATPWVQQQLTWLLGGLGLSCALVLVIYALPATIGHDPLDSLVPGLRQLPILVLLAAFSVAMQRYQVFDVGTIVSRSLVYSMLAILLALLYLAFGGLLGYFFDLLVDPDGVSPYTATILTALVITLVALPLRDRLQQLVDRLFFRQRTSHRQVLDNFTRLLTAQLDLPRLLDLVASQAEQVFHPQSLAILLARDGEGYRVALSHGRLATHGQWRVGTQCAIDDPMISELATIRHPLQVWPGAQGMPDHLRENWQKADTEGISLLVPMHIGSKLAGLLMLGPRLSEAPYTAADLSFASALADQSIVALENARLYDEMEQRATELTMLATISSAISSSLDLEFVLRTIVESVVKVINCDKSAIFELSEDGQYLSLRMEKGLPPAYKETARKLRVGVNNRTLSVTLRQPLIVPDLEKEPRMLPVLDTLREGGYQGFVDVPLVGREGILGVLCVYFDRVHHPSMSELELLTTFANQASIAIDNARLYATAMQERDRATQLYQRTDAALTRRVEELTAIEQISRQLTATLDLEQVMDLVLERVLQATQADRGIISLYKPSQHSVQLLAQVGYPPELERYRTEPWPDDLGITGLVARTGLAVLVPDVCQSPEYVASAATTQSQISVPVRHKGQVIGVVTVESDRQAAFGTEHLRFVELLADHAAIGMNNAQLFQQVMEGRDRLEATLNATRDGVMFIDSSGRVLLTNRRVREILGTGLETWFWTTDLVSEVANPTSPIYDWIDLTPARLSCAFNRPLDGDQVLELTAHLQVHDEKRCLEVLASPVLGGGEQQLGWVVVIHDRTREAELEQFREDLTSMAIHNLQGPLAAIIGSLETLQELDQIAPDMADELLRIALDSGRKLYARIESLLWLRRLEDSKLPLDLQPLPLAGVVETVVSEYLPTSARVGVEIETHFPPELPLVVIDEEVIGRVISNLVDNALKFTPRRGRVEVRAHLSNLSSPPSVVCSVADTGPGINPALQANIFAKFRRGDDNWQGRRKGMGIGLHYCKLAVEAHGGRIWVESQEGQGTTFSFTMPIQHENEEA